MKNVEETPGFLRESAPLLEGLHLGGVGVWRWRVDSDDLRWTPNLEEVHALPGGSFDGTLSSFRRDVHPDDMAPVWAAIRHSVETGEPYCAVYRTAPAEDRPPLWIEASGGLVTAPDGTRYLTGVCTDVSERVRNEEELQRRLRQQQAVVSLGSFALAEDDFQKVLDRAVTVAAEVLDLPLTKILQFANAADHLTLSAGIGWKPGLVGVAAVGIERESQAGFTLISPDPVIVHDLRTETRFNGPQLLRDHDVRSGMSVIIPGADRRPFGVFGVHSRDLRHFAEADVEFLLSLANIVANSARHRAAADQRMLLLREMAHRAGNMLQLVSTIANQTFGFDRDVNEAKRAFNERLASLSRANFLVAQGGWTSTRVVALIEEALQPFRERIGLEGRDILLPPDLCFDLGLIVHELATNSAKYGSLGAPAGEVALRWTLGSGMEGQRRFTLVWDDPLSVEDTNRQGTGFGSRLLTALIERKWRGEIVVDRENGYRFTCVIPVDG